jgi:hypothetical protein
VEESADFIDIETVRNRGLKQNSGTSQTRAPSIERPSSPTGDPGSKDTSSTTIWPILEMKGGPNPKISRRNFCKSYKCKVKGQRHSTSRSVRNSWAHTSTSLVNMTLLTLLISTT